MLLRDLLTVGKNSKYLPSVLGSSTSSDFRFRSIYSESELVFKTPISLAKLVKEAAIGQSVGFGQPAHIFSFGTGGSKDERWLFVNGIATDRDIAVLNARCLYAVFGQPINVVYNPTYGVIADLAECAFERTFDRTCLASIRLTTEILSAIQDGLKVKVIAHSQGGIIASRMLEQIRREKNFPKDRLEVYTFASGADEDVEVPGVYQEHFLNSQDFVSRIGLMNVQTIGTKYVRDSVGHLLNRDYIEHFVNRRFCYGRSRLYSHIHGGRT